MAQIKIENLNFKYKTSKKPALTDINLEIDQGDVVVLCGKSGSGKSTLLRNLKKATMPVGERSGNILLNGEPIDVNDDAKLLEQARQIGFIMQNPDTQIVTDRVYHELAFGLENMGVDSKTIRIKVAECVEYFGIRNIFYSDTGKLSGGQKQLVNLAATMTLNPSILLLDEPTSQLDPIAAERFMDTVKKINEELGITVVIAEHRLDMVSNFADKLVILDQGKVTMSGDFSDVVQQTRDKELIKYMPYSAQISLKYAKKGIVNNKDFRKWLWEVCAKSNKNVNDNSIGKLHSDLVETCEREKSSEIAVDIKNVYFRYEKPLEDVLKNFKLKVKVGEVYGILGGNGSGKTTAIKVIAGALKAYKGKIKVHGTIGYLPQDVQTLFLYDTVTEELEGVDEGLVKKWIDQDILESHPYDLSGGQQQKVAMLKILKNKPNILLLDEPTKGIDAIQKKMMGDFLLDLKKSGCTILMVSHDLDFCSEYADRCGMFFGGEIIAQNATREFFLNNNYYTTTIKKIVGNVIENAVTIGDVDEHIG